MQTDPPMVMNMAEESQSKQSDIATEVAPALLNG